MESPKRDRGSRSRDKSSSSRGGQRSGTGGPRGRTRDQLYNEARKLHVEGRSKMNKDQLRRAVDARTSDPAERIPMRIGYFLSSEEWGPQDLVAQAVEAEEAGFDGLWISDHYHPWNDEQGHSPFVWSTIGAIAQATSKMKVTTAVTCPTIRIHPAIVAQAAATSAVLLDGRFCLGLGSGEALNEHILGDRWPGADERLEMLEEAVDVIRTLWRGGVHDYRGDHYRVEHARIYDVPESPPPIVISGFGHKSVELGSANRRRLLHGRTRRRRGTAVSIPDRE